MTRLNHSQRRWCRMSGLSKLPSHPSDSGDIEPLNQHTVGRIDTMLTFATEFRRATGEPISFIQADIGWGGDYWRPQLVEWQKKADAAGIGLGVIINGDNQDKDDWRGRPRPLGDTAP